MSPPPLWQITGFKPNQDCWLVQTDAWSDGLIFLSGLAHQVPHKLVCLLRTTPDYNRLWWSINQWTIMNSTWFYLSTLESVGYSLKQKSQGRGKGVSLSSWTDTGFRYQVQVPGWMPFVSCLLYSPRPTPMCSIMTFVVCRMFVKSLRTTKSLLLQL